jgi:hypothetical protein
VRQVQQIWENCVTVLYDRANQSENVEVETEEEVDEDEKCPYILHSDVGKNLSRKWGIWSLQGMMMYLEIYSDCRWKMGSK